MCVGLHSETGLQQLQDFHRDGRVLSNCLHGREWLFNATYNTDCQQLLSIWSEAKGTGLVEKRDNYNELLPEELG